MRVRLRISIILCCAGVLAHTASSGATPKPFVAPRLPVNARCPHHGYPFSDKAYAAYVANHPLMQPGISEQLAKEDPVWYSKQMTEFVFTSAQYAADYLDRIQPLNTKRPFQFTLDCGSPKYRGILSGKQRQQPATIIWGSRFSYETPLLLYNLHTYRDLVDFFYIAETVRVDHSQTPKPLLFERVKHHFLKFLPQIVHQVIDDTSYGKPFNWSDSTATVAQDVWTHEKHHLRQIVVSTLKQFAKHPDDTVVLHGDIDEVPDEDFLFHLKRCELEPNVRFPIRSSTVMWLYDYRYIRTASFDDPNPFSYRYPLVFTLGHLRAQDPSTFGALLRQTVASDPKPAQPGGWHFSYPLFAPTFYLKLISMAEAGGARFFGTIAQRTVQSEFRRRRLEAWQWGSGAVPHPKCLVQRFPMYKEFVQKVPWLMAQNVQQFAFFIPCLPAFYDRDQALERVYHNCNKLVSS